MIKSGARLSVMAERIHDRPAGWSHLTPKIMRARARAWWQPDRPVCSCAEENVLGYPAIPTRGCILITELAQHSSSRMVNVTRLSTRGSRRYDAREAACAGRLCEHESHEYFARRAAGSTTPFNDNEHNHVHLRSQLIEYDPGLAAWPESSRHGNQIHKPATPDRSHADTIRGSPTFSWPERSRR